LKKRTKTLSITKNKFLLKYKLVEIIIEIKWMKLEPIWYHQNFYNLNFTYLIDKTKMVGAKEIKKKSWWKYKIIRKKYIGVFDKSYIKFIHFREKLTWCISYS